MNASTPVDASAAALALAGPADWVKWFSWRGSPQLVAQVARAAQRAAGAEQTSIVVSVGEDEEVFSSPTNFVKDATPEALREFKTIRIVAAGATTVAIDFIRDPTKRTGPGPDEGVLLQLYTDSSDPDAIATATKTVAAAINRGAPTRFAQPPVHKSRATPRPPPRKNSNEDLILFGIAGVGTFAILALAVVLTNSLTGGAIRRMSEAVRRASPLWLRHSFGNVPSAAVVLAITVAAAVFSRSIRPAIEVAPPGQTRLRRFSRYIAGLLVTLAIAALSKKVLKL